MCTHTPPPPRRVAALLASVSEKIVFGGDTDDDECYISPTLVTNVTGEDDIMKEEIFGPILPFVTVDSVDKAIEFVNSRWLLMSTYFARCHSKGTCIYPILLYSSFLPPSPFLFLPFSSVPPLLSLLLSLPREKPLALYIFTESKHTLQLVTQNTSTGAITHNDTFLHASGQPLVWGEWNQRDRNTYHPVVSKSLKI